MKRPLTAVFCLAVAILSFLRFPGHTWLQQDTQIYVPILEHERDPAVLRNDLLVQRPHVAFTLYDDVARALRAVTGLGFREVLEGQQIVTRAFAIWGFLLLAAALGFDWSGASMIALICALGAMITGPQVLSFEYEPTPRAFAIPLVFCAMGLAARRRFLGSAIAAAAAFLYHPPAALPFCILLIALAIWRRRWWTMAPLVLASGILLLHAQGGGGLELFTRLTALQEQVQRLRTPYVWISTWHAQWIVHHCLLFLIAAAAFLRLRPRIKPEFEIPLLGLTVLGMLSMPVSWLLLEHWKWSLIPQVQPMRMLLFVAVAAQFLTAAAGVQAVIERRIPEGAAWFLAAYLVAYQPVWTEGLALRAMISALLVAVLAIPAMRYAPLRIVAFFLLPVAYPALHTPELAQLSAWARSSTSRDAVFLFPDAGHNLAPGIFRAEALRAVFVDWKSGGQVNYLREFTEEWWTRWQLVNSGPVDLAKYGAFGVSYVVVRPEHRLPVATVYQNRDYLVYSVKRIAMARSRMEGSRASNFSLICSPFAK